MDAEQPDGYRTVGLFRIKSKGPVSRLMTEPS
jgi:hypothetical protein